LCSAADVNAIQVCCVLCDDGVPLGQRGLVLVVLQRLQRCIIPTIELGTQFSCRDALLCSPYNVLWVPVPAVSNPNMAHSYQGALKLEILQLSHSLVVQPLDRLSS
jgi:hypothetical protein